VLQLTKKEFMTKVVRGAIPLMLSLAALIVGVGLDEPVVALGLAASGLLVAFALPSVIGAVTSRSTTRDVDVTKVKAYRQEHPESTIMDTVHATDRQ